ncbi:hypothetical protein N7474_010183 [Penicillium riverlandense]|uniref:uncharacterized protein n=1 Tax=Penicillium riverlandense TaxID=1903569 RepID=UPI0025496704|nr:uncharacterized protein N7474_010183 [Penicillium riverlandense]KAJ5808914.1 hypothetical protein N7474_010183 [Penicillium riverlandense]
MARVLRGASARARRAPSRAAQRRVRKHKVILESVTQEKRKLLSVISFEAKAPPGYTFIPAGNPHLTTACKERCRKEALKILAVTTTPHHNTHGLSQHVHRIGYHFPSTVVAAACLELGMHLTTSGKAFPLQTMGKAKDRKRADSDVSVSQITLNTEARDVLKDLFPNIPANDLNQIIKTAFQKGQGKVGTAAELPLARRAQLAVVAHIRHIYTAYDSLLKTTSFQEARTSVEQPTLAKLVEWRGDDENGRTVLEDVFREVIVISDDEDSEMEEEVSRRPGNRDYSVEILSRNARIHEIQPQSASTVKPTLDPLRELSDEEAPPGFRFVTRVPAKDAVDRRGFSRYQAWDSALNRYRAGARSTEQVKIAPAEHRTRLYDTRQVTAQETVGPTRHRNDAKASTRIIPDPGPVHSRAQRLLPAPAMDRQEVENRVSTQEAYISVDGQRNPPNYGSPGKRNALTHKNAHKPHTLNEVARHYLSDDVASKRAPGSRPERLPLRLDDRTNAPVFVSGPNEQLQGSELQSGLRPQSANFHHARPALNPQDCVLPSIETPWPLETRRSDGRLDYLTKRMSGVLSLRSETPSRSHGLAFHQDNLVALDDNRDQISKRRRLANHGVVPHHDPRPDPRNARPVLPPVSKSLPGDQYRQVEAMPPQDRHQMRRDHLPVKQTHAVGHLSERNLDPYALRVNPDAGPTLERKHFSDAQLISVHPLQPGYFAPGDGHTIRAAPEAGARRAYYDDRSPHVGHVSFVEQPWISSHRAYIDDALPVRNENPPNRHIYAEDFVRPIDIRDPDPFEYVEHRPGHEISDQPGRARVAASDAKDPPQTRVVSDPHGRVSTGSRVVRSAHDPPILRAVTTATDQPPSGYHERRPGVTSARHFHDPPRSSQILEQDRPVYVQRVEPHTPAYSVSDGRSVVIVD